MRSSSGAADQDPEMAGMLEVVCWMKRCTYIIYPTEFFHSNGVAQPTEERRLSTPCAHPCGTTSTSPGRCKRTNDKRS